MFELLHSLQNEQKEGIHNQRIDLSKIKSNTSGVQCEISTNGREGIEKFGSSASGYYDVILMDLRMPVMGGREATMVIRTQNRPDAQAIPILIMTADVFAEDRTELLRAGAADFVYKPVDMMHLRDTLLICLQESKSHC